MLRRRVTPCIGDDLAEFWFRVRRWLACRHSTREQNRLKYPRVLVGDKPQQAGCLQPPAFVAGIQENPAIPHRPHEPPATASSASSESSLEGTGGSTKWNSLSVFSTTVTAMPAGTSMPSAFRAAAGLAISSTLKAGSRHALAMILPNALSVSGMVYLSGFWGWRVPSEKMRLPPFLTPDNQKDSATPGLGFPFLRGAKWAARKPASMARSFHRDLARPRLLKSAVDKSTKHMT